MGTRAPKPEVGFAPPGLARAVGVATLHATHPRDRHTHAHLGMCRTCMWSNIITLIGLVQRDFSPWRTQVPSASRRLAPASGECACTHPRPSRGHIRAHLWVCWMGWWHVCVSPIALGQRHFSTLACRSGLRGGSPCDRLRGVRVHTLRAGRVHTQARLAVRLEWWWCTFLVRFACAQRHLHAFVTTTFCGSRAGIPPPTFRTSCTWCGGVRHACGPLRTRGPLFVARVDRENGLVTVSALAPLFRPFLRMSVPCVRAPHRHACTHLPACLTSVRCIRRRCPVACPLELVS